MSKRQFTEAQLRRRAEQAKLYRKDAKKRKERADKFLSSLPAPGHLRLRSNIKRLSTPVEELTQKLSQEKELKCMVCGVNISLVNSTLGKMIKGMKAKKVGDEQIRTFLHPSGEVIIVPVEPGKMLQPILKKGRVCPKVECLKQLDEVIPEWAERGDKLEEFADHEEIGWGYSEQKDYDGATRRNLDWMRGSMKSDPKHVKRFNPTEKGVK
jgi:hypothetical protein